MPYRAPQWRFNRFLDFLRALLATIGISEKAFLAWKTQQLVFLENDVLDSIGAFLGLYLDSGKLHILIQ